MRASESRVGSEAARALDRARVYAALADLLRPPTAGKEDSRRERRIPQLGAALARLGAAPELREAAYRLEQLSKELEASAIERSHALAFDPSGGLRCSPYETAHTCAGPGEALLRNYRMADVAGFYGAFGVEVRPESDRPDHIAAELEFMNLLTVKEAIAAQEGDARGALCRDAQRAFLRDHLGRWAERFAEAIERDVGDPFWSVVGRLLAGFVSLECRRLGVELD